MSRERRKFLINVESRLQELVRIMGLPKLPDRISGEKYDLDVLRKFDAIIRDVRRLVPSQEKEKQLSELNVPQGPSYEDLLLQDYAVQLAYILDLPPDETRLNKDYDRTKEFYRSIENVLENSRLPVLYWQFDFEAGIREAKMDREGNVIRLPHD